MKKKKTLRATDCMDLKDTKGKYSGSSMVFTLLCFNRSTKESKT